MLFLTLIKCPLIPRFFGKKFEKFWKNSYPPEMIGGLRRRLFSAIIAMSRLNIAGYEIALWYALKFSCWKTRLGSLA